ncbi:rab gtpase [Stylonychia lemnae]|uniref:Rab gtpase n=1 Tax=Stylonychia lemnae TaxID=5949 RepID=A0A078AAL0_STYLE|nr:rab gtpase [Stylonychia lemnae]|eukprot:CDW79315.1 rab gtpase [Stylonychia lemnae]
MTETTENPPPQEIFKVVLVGDEKTGKSQLLSRVTQDQFDETYRSTIGCEFGTKTYEINNRFIKLQLWDTAGQQRFASISRAYYRGANAIILCYDITNADSFNSLEQKLKEAQEIEENVKSIIVMGCKNDLEDQRQVTIQSGQEYANSNNAQFFEVSALNSNSVHAAFNEIMNSLIS